MSNVQHTVNQENALTKFKKCSQNSYLFGFLCRALIVLV